MLLSSVCIFVDYMGVVSIIARFVRKLLTQLARNRRETGDNYRAPNRDDHGGKRNRRAHKERRTFSQ